jgi:hypothetical protein
MPIQGNHNETFTHVVYRPGRFRQNQFDLLIGNFLRALSIAPFLEEVIETGVETLTVFDALIVVGVHLQGKKIEASGITLFSHLCREAGPQLIRTWRDITAQRRGEGGNPGRQSGSLAEDRVEPTSKCWGFGGSTLQLRYILDSAPIGYGAEDHITRE